jgi:hypothetical protein
MREKEREREGGERGSVTIKVIGMKIVVFEVCC